ncbi:MAG: tetratricopeptide repeat protein [Paramuribaculum sp.]|nr:tetratricopeptide repeat protein [Paramuribaculum sp.]
MLRLILSIMTLATALCAAAQTPRYLELVDSAQTAIAEENWQEAERCLLGAMRHEPSSPGNILLMSNLGIVRFHDGRETEAVATLSDAIAMAPNATVVIANRARVLAAIGRDDEALADYTRVLAIDSLHTDALFNRGMRALAKGDTRTAAAVFRLLEKTAPRSRDTAIATASLLNARGDYAGAIRSYDRLLELSPTDDNYLLGRATCHIMLEQFDRASADLNEAIRHNPLNPELFERRAALNRLLYRNSEAESDMRRARKLRDTNDNRDIRGEK